MLDADFDVLDEAQSAQITRSFQSDFSLDDLCFQGHSDEDSIAKIRAMAPEAKVIVISDSLSPLDRLVTERAGALAISSQTTNISDIVAMVTAFLQGTPAAEIMQEASASAVDLTRKQVAVLSLIVNGKSNKEASHILKMSPETVKSHLSEIYRRLEVSNRAEAVSAAHQRGII